MSVCTAESCTGGRIASMITPISKSSDHLVGGVVSYSKRIVCNAEKVLGRINILILNVGMQRASKDLFLYKSSGTGKEK